MSEESAVAHQSDCSPDQNSQRTARIERAVRRVFAATLFLEAITVLFIPRTIAQFGDGLTTTKLILLLSLAAALIGAAFWQKSRAGFIAGSVLQLAIIACGFFTSAMFVLGSIFGLIWIYELRVRRELLTPANASAEARGR